MNNKCIIIGGEIAALRAARELTANGVPVILINPSNELGETTKMFQRGISDFAYNTDILSPYLKEVSSNPKVVIHNKIQITKVIKSNPPFEVEIEHKGATRNLISNTVIFASGFDVFNGELLEEYGYGILEGVITVFDLETAFNKERLPINEETERVVFILCVGSRNQRVGVNPDCSAYCCSYSINQALHIKKEFPEVEVVIMYMDIRTVANHEYLYNEARKSGVLFIRGRPSAIERSEDKLITFYEDTLSESQDLRPADLVVLAVGGIPKRGFDEVAQNFGLELTPNGFVKITEKPVFTSTPGVFACGSACEGVKNIQQSLSEGGAAAMAVIQFLTENKEI
ncbi:MAG: FAD-dependent oxidoreductase [Candidatus Hodarchaeota archaeon]